MYDTYQMYETYQMKEHIRNELVKKAQSGIKSTADLDTVWKLVGTYEKLLKIDMLQEASEYSQDGGYSERRKRDSMGRYARDDGQRHNYDGGSSYRQGYARGAGYSEAKEAYLDAKHSYRSTKSPESKREMNVSLHECMEKLREELREMKTNADTTEERENIRAMLHEIGNLA